MAEGASTDQGRGTALDLCNPRRFGVSLEGETSVVCLVKCALRKGIVGEWGRGHDGEQHSKGTIVEVVPELFLDLEYANHE